MISIKINDSEPRRMLLNMAASLQKTRPMLADIGEYMVEATKRRFATGTAPNGTKWKPNTQATMLEFLRRKGGATVRRGGEKWVNPYVNQKRNKGRLNAKGVGVVMGKRPLIGESRRLMNEFGVRIDGVRVVVSSNLEQSRVMQQGAKRGAFGRTKRGAPIPWGDIPARPFLGFSTEDRKQVVMIVREHIEMAARKTR